MKVELHQFTSSDNLEDAFSSFEQEIQYYLPRLARGEGDTRSTYKTIFDYSFANGCILLILGRDDAEALRYFRQALEFGLRSLDAPPGSGGPRVFHAIVERSGSATRTIAIHETPPSRAPRPLTVLDYDKVFTTTVCFGTREEMLAVARYPEERYRNPNLTADEYAYTFLRAMNAAVVGDEARARREAQSALDDCSSKAVREVIAGFLCVLDRDQKGLLKRLEKRLVVHRKRFEKEPGLAEGVICQVGLMLARMAIDRGLSLEDGPYLPVRLLPNYKAVSVGSKP